MRTPIKLVKCIAFLIFMLVSSPWQLQGQVTWIPIPECGDDPTKLENQLKIETDPKYVLRAGAIGGEKAIPVLKTLSKPGNPIFTIPGTAQVALARLDDHQSLDELEAETRHKQGMFVIQAVEKLAHVRTNAAVAILMRYLARNELEQEKGIHHGDVATDALSALIAMLGAPPVRVPFADKSHLEIWKTWWATPAPPRITPISKELPDEQSRCLARLAESGFPDAVRDLYLHLGRDSVPALQELAKLSNEALMSSPFQSVSSAAQVTLAKAGDQQQFVKIAKGLDDLTYPTAITKLRYIANAQSFEALLNSLSLTRFPKTRYYAPDKSLHFDGEKLQIAVMAALSQMVVNPPLPPEASPTQVNIMTWTNWWDANKKRDPLQKVPF